MGIFSGRRREARGTAFGHTAGRGAAVGRGFEPAAGTSDSEVEHARLLIGQGRPVETEQQLAALLIARQAALRSDDPRLYDTRLAYAAALQGLGRADEAEAMYDATVDECAQRFGAGHPLVLLAVLRRAQGRREAGRPEEAAADAQAVLAECESGPYARPAVAQVWALARRVNALALGQAGRHREALAAYDAMLPELARESGAGSTDVTVCRTNRVQQLALLGQFEEAEGESLALLAIAGRLADQGDRSDGLMLSAVAANALGLTYIESGRSDEAELTLRAPLAQIERRETGREIGPSLRLNLVNSLTGQGRFIEALAEAEPLRGDDPHHVGGLALARAEAVHGLGRTAEAEALAEQALAEATAAYSPAHHRVLRARTLLAVIQESGPDLQAVAADWREHYGPAHPRTLAAQAAADAIEHR